jgi:antiviral helicase SKI2
MSQIPEISEPFLTDVPEIVVNTNLFRCVTQTVFKGVIPEIFNGGEEYQKARDQLWSVCQSWQLDEWNEMDLSRVKDLALRDTIAKRFEEMKVAQKGECLKCSQFVKHVRLP